LKAVGSRPPYGLFAGRDLVLSPRLFDLEQLPLEARTRFLEIVIGLQTQPETLRCAEECGETQCRVRRDGTLAQDDFVDAARGYTGRARERSG